MGGSPESDLRRQFETLRRVSSFISHISSLHELLDHIMEESKRILACEASSLLLYDPVERNLYFEVATGKRGGSLKRIKLRLGQGIAGHCAKERCVINVPDVAKDPRFFGGADRKSSFRTRNILAIPLIRKRRLVGVLEVLNKKGKGGFGPRDVELMRIIADEAALAIENATLYRENLRSARLAAAGQTMLSLSHDIKNILNGLVGGMTLVDEGFGGAVPGTVQDGWDIVKKSIGRMSGLILDMLSFSSKKKPLYQKVRLNRLVRDTAALYAQPIEDRKCSLVFELDEAIGEVEIDYQGIERVLLNLVGNAQEALAEGGTVRVRTSSPREGRVLISVEDDGCGIPEENLRKIFEVFFTTKGHKGTGLGLAVVRKIVEEHRGTVSVESAKGRGTVFRIDLPVAHPGGR